jgi:hypothetical protein
MEKGNNKFKTTLVVTRSYDLVPFGRFLIVQKCSKERDIKVNILNFANLRFNSNDAMPLTDEQDKAIIKFMIKHKTDILTDSQNFYTRASNGFVKVSHQKLFDYKTFLWKKELEDCPESWDIYKEQFSNY